MLLGTYCTQLRKESEIRDEKKCTIRLTIDVLIGVRCLPSTVQHFPPTFLRSFRHSLVHSIPYHRYAFIQPQPGGKNGFVRIAALYHIMTSHFLRLPRVYLGTRNSLSDHPLSTQQTFIFLTPVVSVTHLSVLVFESTKRHRTSHTPYIAGSSIMFAVRHAVPALPPSFVTRQVISYPCMHCPSPINLQTITLQLYFSPHPQVSLL